MKKVLKKSNGKILSGIGILTAFILVVSLFFSGVVGKSFDYISAIYAAVLSSLANNDRSRENLESLTINPSLVAAAQMKADDMAEKGYFSHNTPEGLSPWYWFDKAGYKYKYAGENLAVNFDESQNVEDAWMASPTHRWNILNRNFTEIGIATSTGIYQGRETIFVVQMFGRPSGE